MLQGKRGTITPVVIGYRERKHENNRAEIIETWSFDWHMPVVSWQLKENDHDGIFEDVEKTASASLLARKVVLFELSMFEKSDSK